MSRRGIKFTKRYKNKQICKNLSMGDRLSGVLTESVERLKGSKHSSWKKIGIFELTPPPPPPCPNINVSEYTVSELLMPTFALKGDES